MIIFNLPKFICRAGTLAQIFLSGFFSEPGIDFACELVSFATDFVDCGLIVILSLLHQWWAVILSLVLLTSLFQAPLSNKAANKNLIIKATELCWYFDQQLSGTGSSWDSEMQCNSPGMRNQI